MNALQAIGFLLAGMVIGEYFNRRIDSIRKEQIKEAKERFNRIEAARRRGIER